MLLTPLYPKHTPISLLEAQSQDEFVRRVKALPRHAVDDHSQCDYHPLVVCSCGACACQGKPKFCKFHALLYERESECHERSKQVKELIQPSFCPSSSSLQPSLNILQFGVCTCMFVCVSVLSLPPSLLPSVRILSIPISFIA